MQNKIALNATRTYFPSVLESILCNSIWIFFRLFISPGEFDQKILQPFARISPPPPTPRDLRTLIGALVCKSALTIALSVYYQNVKCVPFFVRETLAIKITIKWNLSCISCQLHGEEAFQAKWSAILTS